MAVLTAPDQPRALATDSPAAPALRISRRGEEVVRTMPLAAGKCTVGSSSQCQVCLPSPDVRPLQCLVALVSNVATVTRWAAGVKLNGQEFSKAELTDGDRLTIGEWELEFERGAPVLEEASTAFDDEEPSIEATLDSLQELTLDDASEWDEPQVAAAEPLLESITETMTAATPIVDWPIACEAPPIVTEVAPVVTDEWPVVEEATPVEVTPVAMAVSCLSSHAFADSLVLHLWTANDRARRRAKFLITGLRAARFQADALTADLSAIETELDLARAAYDSHLGNDERLQRELASLQAAAKTPTLEPALAKRAEELEAAVVAQSQELERVTDELRRARLEQERLAELHQLEAARAAQFAKALLEQQALIEAATAEDHTPDDPVAEQAPIEEVPWPDATPWAVEQVPAPSPPVAAEPPAIAASTPSFIDKYRHLLEADDAPAPPMAPNGSRPVIDDEFLSPAKAEIGLSPADESDDALEAYMTNMMRRMRSTSPSYESSQAVAALDATLLTGASPRKPVEAMEPVEFVTEEPFNIEDMKNATRKSPLASDLSALREMANNSARTAIATHNQKQGRESAATKVAISLTAASAAAYIMNSAPALDAWQFWGGAVTGALGVGAAVQALLIERRSRVRTD